MKKFTLLILVLATLSFALTGCRDNKVQDKVTLKIGIPNGSNLMPYSILEGFKAAHPNIEVEVDEAPWNDFNKKLSMQIASNNPSDVFVIDSGYTASLGGMGAALDLSDRINRDIDEEKYTSALFAGKDSEGHVWGIPQGINSIAILYNKKMFDAAGIEYPKKDWTYQDMFDIAKKFVRDTNGDGETDIYGFVSGFNITQGWLPFILSAGGTPLDDSRSIATFNSEKSIEGLKKFRSQLDIGIAPTLPWLSTNGGAATAFYNGKVAMILGQTGDVTAINNNAPETGINQTLL